MHYHIIGKNISECRKSLQLTQEQLAERAGICQQFLSRLERGKSIPSVETIMALSDAMNVEAQNILSRRATHNDEPPCRLRSDDDTGNFLIVIRLEDLPIVDLDLPDTDLDE